MESKRKGFGKGKLVMMSFYRATSKQPLASSSTSSCSKVKPSQGGNPHHHHHHHHHHVLNTAAQAKQRIQTSTTTAGSSVEFIVNQEKVTPSQPKQRVSILLQETTSSRDTYANVDSFYATVAADEGVDLKAGTYISSVRQRFTLQPVNSV